MKTNVDKVHFGPGEMRGRERAFTLVELMVVIATVAMLAVVILPALARTGDNGARAVCINNLRQMGLAVNMYAGENNDYMALANWDGGTGSRAGWLYTPTNGTIPNPVDLAPWKNNPVTAWQTGLWFQYVQNPKAYLCPVDIESQTYKTPTAYGGRANKLSSYVMNGAVCGFGSAVSCKITDAWNPACYLLYGPDENAGGLGFPGAGEFNDGANFPAGSIYGGEQIERLHTANGGEVLSVAGNVQFVTIRTWTIQSTMPAGTGPGPGGKTLAWWSPFSSSGH